MRRVEPTLSGDDDWYGQYGFDRDPFAEGGVQGLFYPGGARQETVEQLQHLARFSDCVLLVAGVAGAGKTATRRHFVAQSAADTRCCVLEAALLEGPEPWLRRLLSGFGLRPAPRAGIEADLQQLVQYCADRLAAGSQSWLVIDDAQHMHDDVLQFLPRLLQAAGRNLRVVFFAEPDWREQLQPLMPAAVPLHTIELQPFERGETHAYIHYRLNTAGLHGESPFNADEMERIHRQSAGLPGLINAEARQILIDGLAVVQQPLTSLPLWHFGVIAATLLALLLLYAWTHVEQGRQAPPVPIPGLAPVTELESPELAAAESVVGSETTAAEVLPTAEPESEAVPAVTPAPAVGVTPTAPKAIPTSPAKAESASKAAAPTPVPAPAVSRPAASRPATLAPAPRATATPAAVAVSPALSEAEALEAELRIAMPPEGDAAAPAPRIRTAPIPSPDAAPPRAASVATKPAARPAATPKPAVTADATDYVYKGGSRAGGAPTGDENYLLGLDPGNFVLQIMGSDDNARVKSFMTRAGVALRVYRKQNGGKEWYSVVYGNYPSRAAAEKAQKNLPRGLAGAKPWVRRVDAVQKEIRAARALQAP